MCSPEVYQSSLYEGKLMGKSICNAKPGGISEGGSSAWAGAPCLGAGPQAASAGL